MHRTNRWLWSTTALSLSASLCVLALTIELAAALSNYWAVSGARVTALQDCLKGKGFVWAFSSHRGPHLTTLDPWVGKACALISPGESSHGDRWFENWRRLTTLNVSHINLRVNQHPFPHLTEALQAFPELHELTLDSRFAIPPDETSRFYSWLGSHRNLQVLSIQQDPPNHDLIRKLQAHPSIQEVTVPVAWVQPPILEVLRSMPKLKKLTITRLASPGDDFEEWVREKIQRSLPGISVTFVVPGNGCA